MFTQIQYSIIQTPKYDYCKWRHELLRNLLIDDMTMLQKALEEKAMTMNIVSDGGVHDYNGNFGMVKAVKSKIVATNKGKMYSIAFHESSYRSELFGVLARINKIHHSETQVEGSEQQTTKLFCNNKSVVKLLNERRETRRTFNQHRHPDVDIEIQIIHELRQLEEMNCTAIIKHVKGHQDTNNSRSLRTEEVLNIEADELTHAARTLPHIKEYHIFPTNEVNLKINHQYINSHSPKMVNLSFHSMALREFYTTKYGWTAKTIESLWWPVYFQSLAKLSDPNKLRIQSLLTTDGRNSSIPRNQ
jgi:hypothetical protein